MDIKRIVHILLFCLCLSGCQLKSSPDALPPGLTVEEYPLQGTPELEPLTFVPVAGTQEQIESLHSLEREKHFPPKVPWSKQTVSLDGDELTAEAKDQGQQTSVQLSRNGEVLYVVQTGDSTPISCLQALWAYDGHWVLEVA